MYEDYVTVEVIEREVLEDVKDGETGPHAERRVEALLKRYDKM
jgi:hypothetical protein